MTYVWVHCIVSTHVQLFDVRTCTDQGCRKWNIPRELDWCLGLRLAFQVSWVSNRCTQSTVFPPVLSSNRVARLWLRGEGLESKWKQFTWCLSGPSVYCFYNSCENPANLLCPMHYICRATRPHYWIKDESSSWHLLMPLGMFCFAQKY